MSLQANPQHTVARCPFHDGPATLDLLLGEIHPSNLEALDLALELRSAICARSDARACLSTALALRAALDDSHYLAFFRVRRWLQRVVVVQVRGHRGEPWLTYPLPLNSARVDEIENSARAVWALAHPEWSPEWTQLRFVFHPALPPESLVGR